MKNPIEQKPIKKVTVLALPNLLISGIGNPIDIFNAAGTMWSLIQGQTSPPLFDVQLVSVDGKPVTCQGGISITPNCAIEDVNRSDLIIVPGVRAFKNMAEELLLAKKWLIAEHKRGTHIASICTGAFLLAETGLLNGKTATTHWGLADRFRARYPKVNLKPHRMITDEGNLFCSGGATAGVDLCLYLVGKYCGPQISAECAKSLVHDYHRCSQKPYAVSAFHHDHGDAEILAAQKNIEKNTDNSITVQTLASQCHMSHRTFERRFKKATGDSPGAYLQRVRVQKARQLLEAGKETFEQITYQVGYEDPGSFRKLFTRHTGLSPAEYRSRFSLFLEI